MVAKAPSLKDIPREVVILFESFLYLVKCFPCLNILSVLWFRLRIRNRRLGFKQLAVKLK